MSFESSRGPLLLDNGAIHFEGGTCQPLQGRGVFHWPAPVGLQLPHHLFYSAHTKYLDYIGLTTMGKGVAG